VRHRAGRGAVVGAVEADAEHGGGGGEGAPVPGSPDEAGAEVAAGPGEGRRSRRGASRRKRAVARWGWTLFPSGPH
jgi:hypothetical protein